MKAPLPRSKKQNFEYLWLGDIFTDIVQIIQQLFGEILGDALALKRPDIAIELYDLYS
ncbi:hypothetical protein D3C76_1817270 [compost metagenome]